MKNLLSIFCRSILLFTILLLGVNGCGKKDDNKSKDDQNNSGFGPGGGGKCDYCGMPTPIGISLDLENAVGTAIMAADGASLRLNDLGLTSDSKDSLIKIDTSGNIGPAVVDAVAEGVQYLDDKDKEQMGQPQTPPRIAALGFAPNGDVYVLFESKFMYMMPAAGYEGDVWSNSSPYTCQLFKLKKKVSEAQVAAADTSDVSNLECVTNQHEIPTWQNDLVMQFSEDSKLYFPAHVPGSWKNIFYEYDPTSGEITEKINGNICYRNAKVLATSGIFYTGNTADSGGDCSGGSSFFRYISPENNLVEVARDWWNFKYAAKYGTTNHIIFYGPDPDSTTQQSWDTACLYDFNADASESRAIKIAKCLNNIYSWANANDVTGSNTETPSLAVRSTARERCESSGQVFLGGNEIKELTQGPTGKIYVAGAFRKKLAGTYKCNLSVNEAHCDNLDSSIATQGACEEAGGTWVDHSASYSDKTSEICVIDKENWTVSWPGCRMPAAGDWTTQVTGVAYVDEESTTDNEKLLKLLSSADETVSRFWVFNQSDVEQVYYASQKSGKYYLKKVNITAGEVTQKVLFSNFEVYNVDIDPNDDSRILFDGLDFMGNSYKLGSMNPALATETAIRNGVTLKQGFTGQIKTLIILPEF